MFKSGLAFLLALTLTAKIGFGPSLGIYAAALKDPELETARSKAAAFLARHEFEIEDWWDEEELRFAIAHRGKCRLLVGPISPVRWSRDLIHRLAPPNGRAFFVFKGSIYDDQPRMRSWTAYFWRKANMTAGRTISYEALFGVVAIDECRDLNLPWTALST